MQDRTKVSAHLHLFTAFLLFCGAVGCNAGGGARPDEEGGRARLEGGDGPRWVGGRPGAPLVTTVAGPLPGSVPWAAVRADDDGVWFADIQAVELSHVSGDGTHLRYPVPFPTDAVFDVALGSDGNVWFNSFSGNSVQHVGSMTPEGYITLLDVPSGEMVDHLAAGPGGDIAFTAGGNVGRITDQGVLTEVSLGVVLGDISEGTEGTFWFTEPVANRIGRLSTDWTVTHFDVPTPESGVASITLGSDGNLWFTEENTGQIGRITGTGVITEFVAVAAPASVHEITGGPDGNLWFTERTNVYQTTRIGRMTTDGAVAELELPAVTAALDSHTTRPIPAVPYAIAGDARELWVTATLEPFELGAVFRIGVDE